MQPYPSQSERRWSECRHYIKNTPGILCVKKKNRGYAKSEKKKLYKKTKNKTMNDFISWTLPNLWDISEVIIEVWLIRQQ